MHVPTLRRIWRKNRVVCSQVEMCSIFDRHARCDAEHLNTRVFSSGGRCNAYSSAVVVGRSTPLKKVARSPFLSSHRLPSFAEAARPLQLAFAGRRASASTCLGFLLRPDPPFAISVPSKESVELRAAAYDDSVLGEGNACNEYGIRCKGKFYCFAMLFVRRSCIQLL